MRRCNPPLMEWLDSPIVYEADDTITPRMIELRDVYFDAKKAAHHYLSLAAGVWKKYIDNEPNPVRKKYLYVLRPLACIRYIELYRKQPPTLFGTVLEAIDWGNQVLDAIAALIEQKRTAEELDSQPADAVLTSHIAESLTQAQQIANALPVKEIPTQMLDELIHLAVLNKTATESGS